MGTTVLGVEVVVGESAVARPLQVFPLFGSGGDGLSYLTGITTLATEAAMIHEDENGASVGDLVVDVTGGVPVLLVEGETFLGAKQNRTLNLTVLCPAGARTVLPVSCVEQGRWGSERPVHRSGRHASAKLRSIKTGGLATGPRGVGRPAQGEVWAEVARKARELGAQSQTDALEDVFDVAEPQVADLVAWLRPAEGQTGLCACVGQQVLGVDLFDRAETLAEYFPALVKGYALDAVVGAEGRCGIGEVERFLAGVAAVEVEIVPATGLGEELHLDTPGLTAHGLRVGGALVHLAAFPVEEPVAG
jgi:hypothetical protein